MKKFRIEDKFCINEKIENTCVLDKCEEEKFKDFCIIILYNAYILLQDSKFVYDYGL